MGSLCLISFANGAPTSECMTTGGNVVGAACVFPFTYGGVEFYKCTTAGGFAPWCYTEVNSQGVGVTGKYGDCGTSSACSAGTTTTTTTTTTAAPTSECITTGGNVVGAACVFPFTYGGVDFYSCTTAGGFAPWCYTEVNSQGMGVTGKYGDCGTSSSCTTTTATSECITTGGNVVGASCVFPFIYG